MPPMPLQAKVTASMESMDNNKNILCMTK